MWIDNLLVVSDTQAFGAAAVSTNSIDLGVAAASAPGRPIGTGEPLGFGIAVEVAGTVAASLVEIISATDVGLTAGIISHASMSIPLAQAVLGALFFLGLPMGTPTQRYLGIRITTAGGTISVTAWLTAQNLFSLLPVAYPRNYAV